MSTTSPKSSSLVKLGFYPRHKTLKVMVLGQAGVGKSAMVVRFITRRYIGEYDPSLEKVYTFHTVIDNEMVYFDILDTAGQPQVICVAVVSAIESECLALEANIRWAEAFILMYSVTDKCSFDECNRLKFLINYNKRRRRLGTNINKDHLSEVPVVLVGNKIDQNGDRMISVEEGQRRSKEIGCVCFHEISVRESIEQVWSVFRDVCRFWRMHNKCPKLRRSGSDRSEPSSPDTMRFFCSSGVSPSGFFNTTCRQAVSPIMLLGRRWTEVDLEEEKVKPSEEDIQSPEDAAKVPFRERASTDSHLVQKPCKWKYPPPVTSGVVNARVDRRMSISMRGNNASC